MTYILSAERDSEQAQDLWSEYQQYLSLNKSNFPASAYTLATSDWYYSFDDHRAPHDAWLEWARFEEPASGERSEIRHLSLRIRLLGAYHDNYLEFFYPKVFAYTLSNNVSDNGHCDWRCDEFRLSTKGHLLHEIEWAGRPGIESRWLIEASDVEFSVFPRPEV
jgi:hypothetical protein